MLSRPLQATKRLAAVWKVGAGSMSNVYRRAWANGRPSLPISLLLAAEKPLKLRVAACPVTQQPFCCVQAVKEPLNIPVLANGNIRHLQVKSCWLC